jgi:hypothetical protein
MKMSRKVRLSSGTEDGKFKAAPSFFSSSSIPNFTSHLKYRLSDDAINRVNIQASSDSVFGRPFMDTLVLHLSHICWAS